VSRQNISVIFLPFAFIHSTSCLEVGTESNLEKKKKIVRSLVQGELAENVAKAAVQATKSLDPDDCYLWALENEIDEEKVTRLQKEFDAEMGTLICFDSNCDSCWQSDATFVAHADTVYFSTGNCSSFPHILFDLFVPIPGNISIIYDYETYYYWSSRRCPLWSHCAGNQACTRVQDTLVTSTISSAHDHTNTQVHTSSTHDHTHTTPGQNFV